MGLLATEKKTTSGARTVIETAARAHPFRCSPRARDHEEAHQGDEEAADLLRVEPLPEEQSRIDHEEERRRRRQDRRDGSRDAVRLAVVEREVVRGHRARAAEQEAPPVPPDELHGLAATQAEAIQRADRRHGSEAADRELDPVETRRLDLAPEQPTDRDEAVAPDQEEQQRQAEEERAMGKRRKRRGGHGAEYGGSQRKGDHPTRWSPDPAGTLCCRPSPEKRRRARPLASRRGS
jgi:hypothetical protein